MVLNHNVDMYVKLENRLVTSRKPEQTLYM